LNRKKNLNQTQFFPAVLYGATILAGPALGDIIVVRKYPPVSAEAAAAVVIEPHFFGWSCFRCVHFFSCSINFQLLEVRSTPHIDDFSCNKHTA
jgi:hypothetical protein